MIAVSGDAERDTEASGVIGHDISASATGTGNRGWLHCLFFCVAFAWKNGPRNIEEAFVHNVSLEHGLL